jgi:hypothetical protein
MKAYGGHLGTAPIILDLGTRWKSVCLAQGRKEKEMIPPKSCLALNHNSLLIQPTVQSIYALGCPSSSHSFDDVDQIECTHGRREILLVLSAPTCLI